MKRATFWAQTVAAILSFAIGASVLVAQQIPDPAPLDDEGFELELPLPRQLPNSAQPSRHLTQAFLGVTFDPRVVNAAVARSVSAGSPADQAGVQAGDTIVSLNGREIGTYDEVLKTVAALQAGDVLDIEISRRVSVRARAVLDSQTVRPERATSYRVEAEPLPAPAEYQNRPRVNRAPTNANPAPRPRPNYNVPQNRSGDVDRNDDANERERNNRVFGRFPRRRD